MTLYAVWTVLQVTYDYKVTGSGSSFSYQISGISYQYIQEANAGNHYIFVALKVKNCSDYDGISPTSMAYSIKLVGSDGNNYSNNLYANSYNVYRGGASSDLLLSIGNVGTVYMVFEVPSTVIVASLIYTGYLKASQDDSLI